MTPGDAAAAAGGSATPADPVAGGDRRYMVQFDLYRVLTFVCVIAQHSVLWVVPGDSQVGWGLVMVLHATRNAFFFLAALVVVYTQLVRPRRLRSLWYRRISQIAVPYLVWTLIYFAYTLAETPMGVSAALSTFQHDLLTGYYQLYFLVVLFQFFVVLPGLLWLLRALRRHHLTVFTASLVFQLAMMTISHYFSWRSGALGTIRSVDLTLLQSRDIVGYQLYLVAGTLAAFHFGELQRLVERHARRILLGVLAVFAVTVGYYVFGLAIGNTPGHASDLYQPVAVVWFLSACAGLWALGWRWAHWRAGRPRRRVDGLVTWAADASGGFYLGHVLVLQLIVSALATVGLTAAGTWWAASLLIFVGTLAGTGVLVAVAMRTRLRFVLTGPNRTRVRDSLPAYPAPAAATGPPSAPAPRPELVVAG